MASLVAATHLPSDLMLTFKQDPKNSGMVAVFDEDDNYLIGVVGHGEIYYTLVTLDKVLTKLTDKIEARLKVLEEK